MGKFLNEILDLGNHPLNDKNFIFCDGRSKLKRFRIGLTIYLKQKLYGRKHKDYRY